MTQPGVPLSPSPDQCPGSRSAHQHQGTDLPDSQEAGLSSEFRRSDPQESGNPRVSTRTDSKASLLLAFTGAVLAGLASAADHQLPLVTKVFGALAVLTLGAAAVLLLLVVRPRLGGTDRASFPYWAQLDEAEIRASMTGDPRAARIRVLSGIALRK